MNKKLTFYGIIFLSFLILLGTGIYFIRQEITKVVTNYYDFEEKDKLLTEYKTNKVNFEQNEIMHAAIAGENSKLISEIVDYNNSQEYISNLKKIMSNSNVTSKEIKLLDTENIQIDGLNLVESVYIFTISVSGQGEYENVLQFVDKISKKDNPFKIENLDIFPSNKENQVGINANLSMYVIKYFEESINKGEIPYIENELNPFYYGG